MFVRFSSNKIGAWFKMMVMLYSLSMFESYPTISKVVKAERSIWCEYGLKAES